MNIRGKNAEGYNDPTASTAIYRVMKEQRAKEQNKKHESGYIPMVYICSRYAGDIQRNIKNARRFCRFAVERHVMPVASHLLYPQFIDDNNPSERELGTHYAMILLDRCKELWVFSDGTLSTGMKAEVERAKDRRIAIRYFNLSCQPSEELT